MNGQTMNATAPLAGTANRSRATLVLIFALFVSPLVVAWLLNFTGDFKPAATVNTGTLVQPVRPVGTPALVDVAGAALDKGYFKGKWTFVFRLAGECDELCRKTLYVLRQVRLAQGKNIDRVQRLLLTDASAPEDWAGEVAGHYPGLTLARPAMAADAAPFAPAGKIFLVDPLGNLMMEYAPDADPRGMIKDLERLLRVSYVG